MSSQHDSDACEHIDAPSTGPRRYKRGRGYSFFRGGPKAASVCQVPECDTCLTNMKRYYKRYKICPQHVEMNHLVVEGHKIRFCQQCGRFQSLDEFDDDKKSCRLRLEKHNGRRRKRSPQEDDESTRTVDQHLCLRNGMVGHSHWQSMSEQYHQNHSNHPYYYGATANVYRNTTRNMDAPPLQMYQDYHKAKVLAEAVSMIKAAMDISRMQSNNEKEDRHILQATMDMLCGGLLQTSRSSSAEYDQVAPPPVYDGAQHMYHDAKDMRIPSFLGNVIHDPSGSKMESYDDPQEDIDELMAERRTRGRTDNVIQNALTASSSVMEDIAHTYSMETCKVLSENRITLSMGYYTSDMAREIPVFDEEEKESTRLIDWMFHLTKTNMKSMYEECPGWGWDDDGKYKELDHKDARFFVVSCCSDQVDSSSRCATTHIVENPVGFVHVRYETEDGMPVVYVYEIQISREHQGLKLGCWLMNVVEALGRFFTFSLVMLTVFRNNVQAREFYSRLGYDIDPSSPEDHHDDLQTRPGYLILSKIIHDSKESYL